MSWVESRFLPRLLAAAFIGVAVLLGLRLVEQIRSPLPEPDATAPETVVRESAAPSARADSPWSDLAQVALFGVPGEPVTVVVVEEAPDTSLRLRLAGLIAGNIPELGWALIAEGGGTERLYRVGDSLGSGMAEVHQIQADKVLLKRPTGLETLRLPKTESTAASSAPSSQAAVSAPAAADQTPQLSRSEWLSDPERIRQAVQSQPVFRDGVLYGVAIRPVRNARQFHQAGFRPGDVLVSVAGLPVGAIEDVDRQFEELANQASVEVVIERGGQAVPLRVQLTE
jgi:general secretion pathway protein C